MNPRDLANLENRVTTLERRLTRAITTLQGDHASLSAVGIIASRRKLVTLPAIAIGPNSVAVAWDTPLPSADYFAWAIPVADGSGVGGVAVALLNSSQTAAGCTFILVNGLLAIISSGKQLAAMALHLG